MTVIVTRRYCQMYRRARPARERRRPGGGGVRGPDSHRVPLQVQEGRGHRPGVLPPLRPQRGGRAHVHATLHVQENQNHEDEYVSSFFNAEIRTISQLNFCIQI